MPSLFQTYKMTKDPKTGKVTPVLNAKGEKIPHPKYRGKLQTADGQIRKVTLTRNKAESERLLFQMQDEQDKIRKGLIPVPDKFNKALRRPYAEVVAEYIAWGSTQGGRGGRSWAAKVTDSHRVHLAWWGKELSLVEIGDMAGTLPVAEKALRAMLESGKSGKTLNHYRNDLFGFCEWCRKRGYLKENPFTGLERFASVPVKDRIRRDWTFAELRGIIDGTPEYRSILYETAVLTGYRANELRSLSVTHLDAENHSIRLDAEFDKGRKDREQYISPELTARLQAFIASGAAAELYGRYNHTRRGSSVIPARPLLFVPYHTDRMLYDDLAELGIEQKNERGKLDFHSLRVAFDNLLLKAGADVKTAQDMMRHSTPQLTLNVYGRADADRKREMAGKVRGLVFGVGASPISGQYENSLLSNKSATPYFIGSCAENNMVAGAGFEPAASGL